MPATDKVFAKVGIIEETTFGVTPSAALQLLNAESFVLGRPRNLQRPEIFTNDRRLYPQRITQEDGSLEIAAPIQYANQVLLREGLFFSDESSLASITDIDISCTANVLNDAAGAGFGIFQVGDMVHISGAGFGGGNAAGWYGPITVATTSNLTFPSGQISNFSAGGSVTVKTIRMVDGTTAKSYSVEQQLTQLTNSFRNGKGFRVQRGMFSWKQGDFARESFTLIGKAPIMAAATIGTGGPTAAPTTGFMNSVQDFGTIRVDAGSTLLIVSSLDLELENVLSPYYGLGSVGPQEIAYGSLRGTVSFSVIMDDAADTFMDKVEAHNTVALQWSWKDPQGNQMAILLPACKVDEGDPQLDSASGIAEIQNFKLSIHDPAKDSSSPYVSSGFNRMVAFYRVA